MLLERARVCLQSFDKIMPMSPEFDSWKWQPGKYEVSITLHPDEFDEEETILRIEGYLNLTPAKNAFAQSLLYQYLLHINYEHRGEWAAAIDHSGNPLIICSRRIGPMDEEELKLTVNSVLVATGFAIMDLE